MLFSPSRRGPAATQKACGRPWATARFANYTLLSRRMALWGTRPRRLCATRTLNHSTHGAPCHRIDTYRAGTPGCQARRTASALGVAPAAALRPRLLMPRELRRNRFACIRACQRGAFAVECFSVASRQAIRAFSSGGERFPDTEEVRSSNLLTPTIHSQLRGYVSGLLSFAPRLVHARSAQLVSAQLVHTLSAKPWATIRSWTRLPYNFGAFYLTITSSLTLQL